MLNAGQNGSSARFTLNIKREYKYFFISLRFSRRTNKAQSLVNVFNIKCNGNTDLYADVFRIRVTVRFSIRCVLSSHRTNKIRNQVIAFIIKYVAPMRILTHDAFYILT